jgi:SET domain-containing protein
MQHGVTVRLEVYKTADKGWACRARDEIPRGRFIAEYVGEMVDEPTADKRGREYTTFGINYLWSFEGSPYTYGEATMHLPHTHAFLPLSLVSLSACVRACSIDPTRYGNVARLFNHSCSPNMIKRYVRRLTTHPALPTAVQTMA